jgi:hypothetical protein
MTATTDAQPKPRFFGLFQRNTILRDEVGRA